MQSEACEIDIKKDRSIINVLGEVCWGFQIDNFEEKIGAKREVVEALLDKLLICEKKESSTVCINDVEVDVIKKSAIEVAKEIEQWEFHARIGISLEELMNISIFK